jgi:hypothetical protein
MHVNSRDDLISLTRLTEVVHCSTAAVNQIAYYET